MKTKNLEKLKWKWLVQLDCTRWYGCSIKSKTGLPRCWWWAGRRIYCPPAIRPASVFVEVEFRRCRRRLLCRSRRDLRLSSCRNRRASWRRPSAERGFQAYLRKKCRMSAPTRSTAACRQPRPTGSRFESRSWRMRWSRREQVVSGRSKNWAKCRSSWTKCPPGSRKPTGWPRVSGRGDSTVGAGAGETAQGHRTVDRPTRVVEAVNVTRKPLPNSTSRSNNSASTATRPTSRSRLTSPKQKVARLLSTKPTRPRRTRSRSRKVWRTLCVVSRLRTTSWRARTRTSTPGRLAWPRRTTSCRDRCRSWTAAMERWRRHGRHYSNS